MPAERGVTLVEVVVAISCSTVLLLALTSISSTWLTWTQRLDAVLQRDENLDLVPLILVPLLTQTGNNWNAFSVGPLEVGGEEVLVRSDTWGPGQFPDGTLDDPFEFVSLRTQSHQLQMKSGGGSYQPLLSQVAETSWWREGETLLHLSLEATSSGPGTGSLSSRRLQLLFFLSNLAPTLFSI